MWNGDVLITLNIILFTFGNIWEKGQQSSLELRLLGWLELNLLHE